MAREGAGKDIFSSMSQDTVAVPESERLSQIPESKPSSTPAGEVGRERPLRFEAPVFDDSDGGIQPFARPDDGVMYVALAKGQDQKAARGLASTLRNVCGENHLGATVAGGKLEATRSIRTTSGREGEIVNPREDFADLATNGSARLSLEIVQAKDELNEMTGQPSVDTATFESLVYDQRTDPKDFYGVDLDPGSQSLIPLETSVTDPGERLIGSVSRYSKSTKRGNVEMTPDLERVRFALPETSRVKFTDALRKFAEIRYARPGENLDIDDPVMREVFDGLDAAVPDERLRDEATTVILTVADGRSSAADQVELERRQSEVVTEAAKDSQAILGPVVKELNRIAVIKPTDASPGADRVKQGQQTAKLENLVRELGDNEVFNRLNPDARLNITEQLKSKAKAKGIVMDDATRESIDRLHEFRLEDEESGRVAELLGSITRFGKNPKTGERRKVSLQEIRMGMKNAPDLSPIERITLYDRLLRNGYVEKGSPEAEAILSERRVQVATTGDARVYAVSPDLRVRDITTESETAGGTREVPVGTDPTKTVRKKLTSGNFHAEPGTTIVVTRQRISGEDMSRRFQTQPDNFEGIREELDRGQDSQTVIFKVK